MRGKYRSTLGISIGLCVGASLYGLFREFAPSQFAFATAVIGTCAGLGARLGSAFGTSGQLRIIIFGSLFSFVGVEYLIFWQQATGQAVFLAHLLTDITWLGFSVAFLVFGIIFGVRLLVGIDPVSDILIHGSGSSDASGSECIECGSRKTLLDSHTNQLTCLDCGYSRPV